MKPVIFCRWCSQAHSCQNRLTANDFDEQEINDGITPTLRCRQLYKDENKQHGWLEVRLVAIVRKLPHSSWLKLAKGVIERNSMKVPR